MKLDGGRVRERRERMALSIEDVSTKARVSPHTWVRAEHGEEIRPSSARRVAAALGVEPERLMGGTSGPLGEAPSPPETTDEERREAEMLDELPEELREQLIEELEELGLETLVALQVKGFAKGTLLHAAVTRALARVSARTGIRGGWEETEYSARLREQGEQRECAESTDTAPGDTAETA